MARYIDAEKLIEHLKDNIEECETPNVVNEPVAYGTVLGLECVLSYAETLPTADVVEVKHGEWIEPTGKLKRFEGRYVICSHCNVMLPIIIELGEYYYCPNCGAKMDGK